MHFKTLATLSGIALISACQSSSHDSGVAPASYRSDADHRRVAAEMSELSLPGPEHAQLADRVGTWSLAIRTRLGPNEEWHEDEGVATYKSVLGGRYLLEEVTATIGGQAFEEVRLLGYSKLERRYVSVWADTASTWPTIASGGTDSSGLLFWHGTLRDIATPQGRPFRMDTKHVSPDENLTEVFDTIDGELVKVMEIRETRRS